MNGISKSIEVAYNDKEKRENVYLEKLKEIKKYYVYRLLEKTEELKGLERKIADVILEDLIDNMNEIDDFAKYFEENTAFYNVFESIIIKFNNNKEMI